MGAFTFHVDYADRDPLIRTRTMANEGEALVFAQQLLRDWPDCERVDVLEGDQLLTRLHQRGG